MELGTNRRRVAVRWSSAPEPGDAAAAAADLDLWLDTLASGPPADWMGLAERLRATLHRLCADARLTEDPEARALLLALADVEDGGDFATPVDALLRRAAILLPESATTGRLRI